jgi:hypothetical protein
MSMIGNFLQITPAQLQALVENPTSVQALLYPDDGDRAESIDIDKAWHGIHFMLTGEAWGGSAPLANIVLGGTEIGGDVGYGPAHYLTPEELRAAAEAVRELPPDEFARRFDAEKLSANQIYPEIWDEGDETLDYLRHYYETLRAYYLDAAAKGNAMLKYLN